MAYARYCEEGEVGLMEILGFSVTHFYRTLRISFPRRAASFEYFSPVAPDSLMDIETSTKRVGKTSFTLSHTFYKKNSVNGERKVAACAVVTVVAYDEQAFQKTEVPRQLAEALRRFASET